MDNRLLDTWSKKVNSDYGHDLSTKEKSSSLSRGLFPYAVLVLGEDQIRSVPTTSLEIRRLVVSIEF